MYSKRKMCCLIATCSLLVCMFRAEIFAKGNEQQEFTKLYQCNGNSSHGYKCQ